MTAPSASWKRDVLLQRAHRHAAGLFGKHEPQIPRRFIYGARRVGKSATVFRAAGGFQHDIPGERHQLNRGKALSEEHRCGLRHLMRFIEDDGVARGQELAHPFIAQHHVREEQMVVHDDDVGVQRLLARVHDEAAVEVTAVRAEAVLASRSNLRPYRRRLRHAATIRAIAGQARARETFDRVQVANVFAIQKAAIGDRSLQMMMTHVIGPALEQSHGYRQLQCVSHLRNVAVEELVLERLGARGDDHLSAGSQRGHQIGEGLSRAGACFRDEHRALVDCGGDGARQVELTSSDTEAFDYARERAVFGENRVEVGHGGILKEKLYTARLPSARMPGRRARKSRCRRPAWSSFPWMPVGINSTLSHIWKESASQN